MLTVGLTGGIGSGKSAVSARLGELGAVIVDGDLIAREIVEPGQPALAEIVQRFGEDILTGDGSLNRGALAGVVFHDPAALADLNAIMHPRIAARSAELVAQAPHDAVVIHDSPLLVEQDMADAYDVVVVVDCPDDTRLERLIALRGMDEVDARARMAAQATREERLEVADYVIENDSSAGDLRSKVDVLWRKLLEAARESEGDD